MGAAGSGSQYVPRPAPLPAAPIGLQQQTMASGSCNRPNLQMLQTIQLKEKAEPSKKAPEIEQPIKAAEGSRQSSALFPTGTDINLTGKEGAERAQQLKAVPLPPSHSSLGEKGFTRDTQQCHMKIKELQQAYKKTREANSHAGSEPQTCCFYEDLHKILGGDPTTIPKHSVDTFQEPRVTSGNNEEDIVDEEEEENLWQASGGSILPDSQELFLTLEPIPSQDQLLAERDAREGTSGQYTFPIKL
ncbi:hypothetical protein UY3_15511 [Chelonia mydas]|uniref:Myb/SANT-like DNA-binding domain-containing protein n=1 Tax=Chelonia mydas TaxID=8469 RepID=M7BGK9_CHEMY|nr:hypothetical protein UY3_15511 [Chelonia mydas]